VVIDNLNVVGGPIPPDETDTPSIINPDAVLPLSITVGTPADFSEPRKGPPVCLHHRASGAFAEPPLQCYQICGCAHVGKAFGFPPNGRIGSLHYDITGTVKRSPFNECARLRRLSRIESMTSSRRASWGETFERFPPRISPSLYS